jgi:hypothetical protein
LRDGLPNKVKIVCKKDVEDAVPDTIARSSEYLIFAPRKPAFMLLDHDRKGVPSNIAEKLKDAGGFWKAVTTACPALAKAAFVWRRSTSASLYNKETEERLPGSASQHVYIAVKDGSDIERALKTLHGRLWLAGFGYMIVGTAGQLLDRSIIDAAVFGPERLVFEGKPILEPPVDQDQEARRAKPYDGDTIDTKRAITDLTDQEARRIAKLKAAAKDQLAPAAATIRKTWAKEFAKRHGLSEQEAEKIANAASDQHVLHPEFELEFDDPSLNPCTVADVLADPDKYLDQPLADPIEGVAYGHGKAKVFRGRDKKIRINSFAHGGIKYRLAEGEEGEDRKDSKSKKTQSDVLVNLAASAELFHTPDDDNTLADIWVNYHRETWAIKSNGFKRWLTRQYYEQTKSAPNPTALSTALAVLDAKARFDGEAREVFLRVAGHGGKIYLDLCDKDWRVVEIDTEGWRVLNDAPVPFVRRKGMKALPEPVQGGKLWTLEKYINVRCTRSDLILTLSWLLGALHPHGPYPVLDVTGENGTAKSTLLTFLRDMIDPNTAELRAPPREERDLFIAASNSWIPCYDNLSFVPDWLSDAFARLSTGGGYSSRQLYTDDEERLFTARRPILFGAVDERLFTARRPILLGAVEQVVKRGDLADRIISLTLEPIPDTERRGEKEILAEFEHDRPLILGGLLTAVSHGIKELPNVVCDTAPRMADFFKWVIACGDGHLWEKGEFSQAYTANRAEVTADVVEADPVSEALQMLVTDEGSDTKWMGTLRELLTALELRIGDRVLHSNRWPRSTNALSERLKRVATPLRHLGIEIGRGRGHRGDRTIVITASAEKTKGWGNGVALSTLSQPGAPKKVDKSKEMEDRDTVDTATPAPGPSNSRSAPVSRPFKYQGNEQKRRDRALRALRSKRIDERKKRNGGLV